MFSFCDPHFGSTSDINKNNDDKWKTTKQPNAMKENQTTNCCNFIFQECVCVYIYIYIYIFFFFFVWTSRSNIRNIGSAEINIITKNMSNF